MPAVVNLSPALVLIESAGFLLSKKKPANAGFCLWKIGLTVFCFHFIQVDKIKLPKW
jgi:hypothetical protein